MRSSNAPNLGPQISVSDSHVRVSFERYPFWEGVQHTPGIRKTLPLSLIAATGGPIRQTVSAETISEVVNAYQSDEYKYITPPPGASFYADERGEGLVDSVISAIGDRGRARHILEIGGGGVWVAKRLVNHFSPETYLIMDPSVKESSGDIEVMRDFFPNSKIKGRKFDLIIGLSVLEHVTDPVQFLLEIRKHLTVGGRVMLIFPDCEHSLRMGDLNVLANEHLTYFTEKSARWIAPTSGFSILSMSSKNDAFTLLLTPELEDASQLFPLDESDLLHLSANMFQNLLTHTSDRIRNLVNDGHRVGFHGATQGLNAFVYLSGLRDHPNIRIYDGDLSKVGAYLPALSKAILSPLDSSYSKNSMLVVSALSFCEQIKTFAINQGVSLSSIMLLNGGEHAERA
jgi:hypothetical protein